MDSLYGSACGAYIYDEDVLDFLVKYDNNLVEVLAALVQSQFLPEM